MQKYPKLIVFNSEVQKKIIEGVDAVANAVKTTLGPCGRFVAFEEEYGNPVTTNDGVTVAKQVRLKDPIANMASQMVIEVASKTNDVSGDGPQPLYSKVLTPTGFVQMKDVKVGTKLCGTDGTTQTVLGVYPKGKKHIWKVTLEDGRVVECCADHLWKVTTNYGSVKTQTTQQISKDFVETQTDGYRKFKYYLPRTMVEFAEDKTKMPIDPYLLGVLLGDGSLRDSGSIELSIGLNKKHIINRLVLPNQVTKSVQVVDYKHSYRVKLKNIRNLIELIGLRNVGSNDKFIPKNYLFSSVESRQRLLQGLIDTDGYTNDRGTFEFSTVSPTLAKDFLTLVHSLGIPVHSRTHTREKDFNSYSDKPIYRITELKGYLFGNKIVGVTKTKKITKMQCIKVSNNDNLYLTDNFVVTHNTTTATVLTQKLVHEGIKNITAGANSVHLIRGMKKACIDMVEEIKRVAKKISTPEEVVQVATISAGDEATGKLVSEAVNKVGKDGVVTIEEGQSSETVIEMVEGMQYDRGYLIPAFVNDPKRMETNYEDCYVACIDMRLNSIQELIPLLEQIAQSGKPALLMINGEDTETLNVLAYNRIRNGIKIVVTHSPAFGERKKEMHKDIAILTGGSVIGEDHGLLIQDVKLEQLGKARRVIVNRDKTTIVGGNCSPELLANRIDEIKGQLEVNKSEYESDKLKERLAKLTGGIAVINVGGVTETEMRAHKYKIEDALNAAKSALEEGIVAGGGVCYIKLASKLKEPGVSDFAIGYNTVISAVKEPFRQIIANTGESPDAIYQKIVESASDSCGYDGNKNEYCNLFERGIVDPAKTTRAALENAVSIASLLLKTDCLVALDREDK